MVERKSTGDGRNHAVDLLHTCVTADGFKGLAHGSRRLPPLRGAGTG